MSSGLRTGVSAVTRTRSGRMDSEGNSVVMEQDRGRSRQGSRNSRYSALEDAEIESLPNISALRSKFMGGSNATSVAKFPRPNSTSNSNPNIEDKKQKSETEISTSIVRNTSKPNAAKHQNADAVEPEKLFEATNHTERFKYTRSIFAKMEEQSEQEREKRHQLFQRSKSPTRYQLITPNTLAISPFAIDTNGTRLTSPVTPSQMSVSSSKAVAGKFDFYDNSMQSDSADQSAQMRVQSASDDVNPPPKTQGSYASLTGRASSVDGLDNDALTDELGRSKEATKSESDLSSTTDSRDDSVPSPKWIMKHYNEVVKGSVVKSNESKPPVQSNTARSSAAVAWQKPSVANHRADSTVSNVPSSAAISSVTPGKMNASKELLPATRNVVSSTKNTIQPGFNDRSSAVNSDSVTATAQNSSVDTEIGSDRQSHLLKQANCLSKSNTSTITKSSTSHSSQQTHSKSNVSAATTNFRPSAASVSSAVAKFDRSEAASKEHAIKSNAAVIKRNVTNESDADSVADRLCSWKSQRRRQTSDVEKEPDQKAVVGENSGKETKGSAKHFSSDEEVRRKMHEDESLEQLRGEPSVSGTRLQSSVHKTVPNYGGDLSGKQTKEAQPGFLTSNSTHLETEHSDVEFGANDMPVNSGTNSSNNVFHESRGNVEELDQKVEASFPKAK